MAQKIPETLLLECEKCNLILRFTEKEFEELSDLPTFCHLIPDNDLSHRRENCIGGTFRKPRGI